jgi:ribosome-binding factor A
MAKEITRGVAQILQHDVTDPRLGFVSVTRTRVSADYKHARVFVSIMGDEKKKKLSMKGLEHAAGFIRSGLAGRLGVRECPTLEFALDDSIDKAFAVTQLLDQIKTVGSKEEEE